MLKCCMSLLYRTAVCVCQVVSVESDVCVLILYFGSLQFEVESMLRWTLNDEESILKTQVKALVCVCVCVRERERERERECVCVCAKVAAEDEEGRRGHPPDAHAGGDSQKHARLRCG